MPGYAYPVGVSTSEAGTSKTISYLIADADINTATEFYTAPSKTKVLSILATNSNGGILPIKLYVYRAEEDQSLLTAEARVLKQKYMVQQLVSGDARVDDQGDQQVDRYKVLTEFFLDQDDELLATCPIEDVVTLTVTLKEGVN